MISASINVSLIKKEKLIKGEKGMYLNIVLFETPDNKYGNDYLIKQSGEKGEEMPILGNGKIFIKKAESPKDDKIKPGWSETVTQSDDLPF